MKHKLKALGAISLTIALSCNMLFVSALAVDEPAAGCTGDESCIAEQHTDTCPKYQSDGTSSNDVLSGALDTDAPNLLDTTTSDWSTPDTSWFDENNTQKEYTLTTAAQLAGLVSMTQERNGGKKFEGITIKLGNDIILNDTTNTDWVTSAKKWDGSCAGSNRSPFAGTFDGCGYSVIGLYSETGLFAKLTGDIQNLTIDTAVIEGTSNVGAIVGEMDGDQILNCHVKNSKISGSSSKVGGVVGSATNVTISGCTVENSSISGTTTVGGICGDKGNISECSVDAASEVSGSGNVGGIVGSIGDSVTDCENAAAVSGESTVGGIAGYASSDATISGCVNSGSVTGTLNTGSVTQRVKSVGGIIGAAVRKLEVSDCINQGEVQGDGDTGGIAGYVEADVTITGCVSEGSVTGTTNVGGILGNSDIITGNQYESGKPNTVSGCTVSAVISGQENVGGLVGNNVVLPDSTYDDTSIQNNVLTSTASVSGTSKVGALIGSNGTETDTGTVKNNFWPESAGTMASGSGAGSSTGAESTIYTNNSSYKEDGTLNTPVPAPEGEESEPITNLGDAIDKVIGSSGEGSVPEVLKATVTYNNGGHGTAPYAQTVTKGSKVTLPSMSNDGYYTFIGWGNGGETYTAGQEVPVMEDMIFTAQWRNDTPSTGGGGGSSDPTYSISLPSKVTGGEISLQKRYAEKGETVTITVTPDDGYELDELIVTDSKGNELDLTDKGNGKFTFKMPAGRVEIEVSFQEIVIEPVNPFVDVSTSDYYYDAVLWAVENGVTNGTSATTFGPNMAVSRAQMVTFLWRAHGSPKATGTNPFTDVSTSDYYYDAVLWAVANGVTNGTSATTFSPDTAVTRSQAVTFQWRAAGSPVVSGSSFGDVATDAYYVNAVTWAVANGITNGTGGNTFSPDVVVSRAQAVTFLYREQE